MINGSKTQCMALLLSLILALPLAACARLSDPVDLGSQPSTENPSAPVTGNDQPTGEVPASPLDPIPGEENMKRGQAFIDKSEVLLLESYPLQVTLHLIGTLPTPCHHLRAKVSGPDAENRIQVELYSLADPEEICIQVIQEFETRLPLGSFPDGSYTIWLNSKQVGEFTQ
jgi:hypothetical protein